jgi:hypothetical protein
MTKKESFITIFESIALIATYRNRCHIADEESNWCIINLYNILDDIRNKMTKEEVNNALEEISRK